jgi:hypothetical protein
MMEGRTKKRWKEQGRDLWSYTPTPYSHTKPYLKRKYRTYKQERNSYG